MKALMVLLTDETAKFSVGQVIHNTLLDYRGVIIDVDPQFQGTHSMPSASPAAHDPASKKSGPWYHVLVDGTADWAYVAERNLEPDNEGGPIDHPDVIDYFDDLTDQGYHRPTYSIN